LEVQLIVIGWWEVIIGITFLFTKTIRIAIGLLFLQMIGAFMPLIFLLEVAYQNGSSIYLPTMEGSIYSEKFDDYCGGSCHWRRYVSGVER